MGLSDELSRLGEMHRHGQLSDAEFARAKALLLEGQAPGATLVAGLNGLRRSRSDNWLAGVCGGLARSTGMESWICRLLFAALLACGGVGVVVYLLMWIFVPLE
jgi:phage shock protein C